MNVAEENVFIVGATNGPDISNGTILWFQVLAWQKYDNGQNIEHEIYLRRDRNVRKETKIEEGEVTSGLVDNLAIRHLVSLIPGVFLDCFVGGV